MRMTNTLPLTSARAFRLMTLAGLLSVLPACSNGDGAGRFSVTLEAAGVVETRAPQPTATPGAITRSVQTFVAPTALDQITLFGLDGADWINLGISLLLVVLSYLLGVWLSRLAVNILSPYLNDETAVQLLRRIGRYLRWLIVLATLNFAIRRLQFLAPLSKALLSNLIVAGALVTLAAAAWFGIDLAVVEFTHRMADQGREQELDPAVTLVKRIARVVLIFIALSALLSLFGINMTAFAALLGITGLAFSLAARDTIADAIAGVIILVDQPFRVGDRIEIAAANTWGDVTDIGLRTTRILTRDNRMVIIPNNLIAKNEIINYTYPDPNYRIETHVGVAYHTDIERARQVMRDAVRTVPTVLADKPVDVLYNDMGDSAMIFRVRWWIQTYADTRRITDQVHTALQIGLDQAGIVTPYPIQSIYLRGSDPALES
jgi:MscS family membrane protein